MKDVKAMCDSTPVDQPELNMRMVRAKTIVPDNELWLHSPEVRVRLDEAMAWASEHPVQVTTPEDLKRLRVK